MNRREDKDKRPPPDAGLEAGSKAPSNAGSEQRSSERSPQEPRSDAAIRIHLTGKGHPDEKGEAVPIQLMDGRKALEEPVYFVPPGGPPQVARPSPEVFQAMGEEQIEHMLADVYAELEQSSIRHMFPRNMERASRKSAAFFIGLLGGPPRYHERYGPPRMRARHMPFPIDEEARQEWLRCFERVLDRAEAYRFPAEHLEDFRTFLDGFSAWMVNRA